MWCSAVVDAAAAPSPPLATGRLLRLGQVALGLLELLAVLGQLLLGLGQLLLQLHDLLLRAVLALAQRPLQLADAVLQLCVLVARGGQLGGTAVVLRLGSRRGRALPLDPRPGAPRPEVGVLLDEAGQLDLDDVEERVDLLLVVAPLADRRLLEGDVVDFGGVNGIRSPRGSSRAGRAGVGCTVFAGH